MISMDTMGPLSEDGFGFKHVLVMIDGMSKFTRLFPLRSTTAEETASRLLEFICKDGLPNQIHSDGGTQFVNEVIQELTDFIGTPHTVSTPYSHEENGLVERVIKDVRAQLHSYCVERKSDKDWSLILPMVERLINTKINIDTGYTPAALKFGNPTALEIVPFNVSLTSEAPVFRSANEYLQSIAKFQSALIAQHKTSRQQSQQRKEEMGNHQRNFHRYLPGDLILVDHTDRSKTDLLSVHRDGPYMVREQHESTVSYEDHSTNRIKDAHISRCHPYVSRKSDNEDLAEAQALLNMYEVESIISHKFEPSTSRTIRAVRIEVKWKGYADSTWEPLHGNMSIRRNIIFVEYAKRFPELIPFIPTYLLDTNS
jgi:hypothetical protein